MQMPQCEACFCPHAFAHIIDGLSGCKKAERVRPDTLGATDGD